MSVKMKYKFPHTTLAKNIMQGNYGNFSKDEAESALRNMFVELNGGSSEFDFKSIRRNKVAIFEVIEEVLDVMITEGIENQFGDLVEYRNVNFGDKNAFMVEDYHLFKVATVSAGNNSVRRQRLERTPFYVNTQWKSVSFYDEWERFMGAKTDFAKLVNKVQRSFNAQIAADIYTALTVGYQSLATPYLYQGTYDRTELVTLSEHIRAATDREVMIFGTKSALAQATPFQMPTAGDSWDQRNQDGYFRVIDGLPMIEIPQAHVPGTDTFAISDKLLLAVPMGEEKIIKLVLEGESRILETGVNDTTNEDDSVEYLFKKKYGAAVITSTKYGAYELQ